jgi:hypothetical protein
VFPKNWTIDVNNIQTISFYDPVDNEHVITAFPEDIATANSYYYAYIDKKRNKTKKKHWFKREKI